MGLAQKATFADHVQELRNRLFWTILFLLIGAVLGYFIHDTLIMWLQRPLHDSLYYTTPGGAFSFIIKVCTVFGLIVALPVLIYQVFAFFGPLIRLKTRRSFITYIVASFLLAAGGIAFAYYISLPAALHFLVSFGSDSNIHSLITANEYFNFVLTYIAGFAVLFQVPLIVLLIDKIKPTPPTKFLGALRYVVLFSFIVAAVITPTPDPVNQALMAGPIILLYVLSILLVAIRALRRRGAKPVHGPANPVISKSNKPKYHQEGAHATQNSATPPNAATTKKLIVSKPNQTTAPRLISDFMVVPKNN
jgi:sec-independent protein translocase protein TatC